jgi:flagellar protein FlaF
MPSDDSKYPSSQDHANAANLYGSNVQKNTPDQRELEAHVLIKSAKFLTTLQDDWENVTPDILEETLKYNRQIWMMFYDTALENAERDRPNDLRSNIINLANFVFKRELDIMSEPKKEKLNVLININREIAAGLMTKQASETSNSNEEDTKKPPEGGSTITSA